MGYPNPIHQNVSKYRIKNTGCSDWKSFKVNGCSTEMLRFWHKMCLKCGRFFEKIYCFPNMFWLYQQSIRNAPFQFYDFRLEYPVSLQSSHLEFDEFHFKFAFQFPFCSIFYAAVGARRNVHNGTICLHFCRGSTNCF